MLTSPMVPYVTPERIYALCQLICSHDPKQGSLRDLMEPKLGEKTDNTNYFPEILNTAKELNLIREEDGEYRYNQDLDTLSSYASFRHLLNSLLKNYPDSLFYQMTQVIQRKGSDVVKMGSLTGNRNQIFADTEIDPTEINLRAWRFWAAYLGYGILNNMSFLPNAAVFLEDCLDLIDYEPGRLMHMQEFIELLKPYTSIVEDFSNDDHKLNYGFSNALKTLQKKGRLKMDDRLDDPDQWYLAPYNPKTSNYRVTAVTIF